VVTSYNYSREEFFMILHQRMARKPSDIGKYIEDNIDDM
jgi:hypothetical protein